MFASSMIFRLRRAVLLVCGFATLASAQRNDVLPAGVSLPQKGSTYVLSVSDKGPDLTQLHATEVLQNSQAASNFARSMVYAGPHASVEPNGTQAAISVDARGLALLVRLSDEETDLMRNRLTLVRLRQTDKRRVVSTYSQNIFGGQHKKQYEFVAVTKTDVPDSSWVKLTPEKPLEPGEYGLMTMPKDANLFPDAVYDFEVKGRDAGK